MGERPDERAQRTAGGGPGVARFVAGRLSKDEEGASAVMLAIFSAEAGEMDAAFRHLDRAIESRDPALVHLAVAPQGQLS